jgi:hypothetical protein
MASFKLQLRSRVVAVLLLLACLFAFDGAGANSDSITSKQQKIQSRHKQYAEQKKAESEFLSNNADVPSGLNDDVNTNSDATGNSNDADAVSVPTNEVAVMLPEKKAPSFKTVNWHGFGTTYMLVPLLVYLFVLCPLIYLAGVFVRGNFLRKFVDWGDFKATYMGISESPEPTDPRLESLIHALQLVFSCLSVIFFAQKTYSFDGSCGREIMYIGNICFIVDVLFRLAKKGEGNRENCDRD